MNETLRKGIERLLASLPQGCNSASIGWSDDELSYCVSCTFTSSGLPFVGGSWTIWASVYPVLKPTPEPEPEQLENVRA